jgi:hypothetical protein
MIAMLLIETAIMGADKSIRTELHDIEPANRKQQLVTETRLASRVA